MTDHRHPMPPRWIDRVLDWFCKNEEIEILRGDLYELYEVRSEEMSKWKADLYFFFEVLDLFRPFAIKNNSTTNSLAMLGNYFKVTYRNIFRQKVFSALNVTGLAIGLICFILIYLFIQDELSYDRFHTKSDRIYRVLEHFESEGVGEHSASQPFPTGPTLKSEFPRQVEHAVRLFNFQSPTLALANKKQEKAFNESRFFFADSTFLQVFDFELLKGNRQTALDKPNTILITSSMAEKYFGNEDPIGKSLEFQGVQQLEVSGILEDAPANAHFQYDFVASFSSLRRWYDGKLPGGWYWNPCWTYVVLEENAGKQNFESQLPGFVDKYFPDFIKEDVILELQPITDIHLHSRLDYEIRANSDIKNIYIFGAIALFVLLIAAINFINLSTARATKRAKEVGVRKSLGSQRGQLISQFIFESVFMTFLAVFIAIAFVMLLMPAFNVLVDKSIPIGSLLQIEFLIGAMILSLTIGILAGFYPAFVLSSFKAVSVLKGLRPVSKGLTFRKVLVTVQFAISIFLIAGTVVAISQFQHLQTRDTGFDQEHILMIPVIRSPMGEHYNTFRNESLQSTYIRSMTGVEEIIGAKHQVGNYQFEGMERSKPFPRFNVLHDFTETMDIELIAGRDYSRDFVTDDSLALVINEAMVESMGWKTAQDAINKKFYYRGELKGKVVGVVKDYNFVSKHHEIGPLALPLNSRPRAFNLFIKYVAVKVDGNHLKEAITDLEGAWRSALKDRPFDFFFLEDRLNDSYRKEQQLSQITVIFSILAISVACLGLFGLVTFNIERRMKELGLRKVLGIRSSQLMVLLSKEYFYLILIALIISIPTAYILLNSWLDQFAYRVEVNAWPFILAGIITFVVSMVTISFHAVKASMINPAKTLKYE
ncbi:MAG: ABC transporter permease [Cyclobacteriaceae bacterium]